VSFLARHFFGLSPTIKIKTSSWELGHHFKEYIATTKDVLACYLPFLNTIQRAQRIAKAKLR
jgi:hypothetical protein